MRARQVPAPGGRELRPRGQRHRRGRALGQGGRDQCGDDRDEGGVAQHVRLEPADPVAQGQRPERDRQRHAGQGQGQTHVAITRTGSAV